MDINNKSFVAYYRVSTLQQGRSGLGLEAQQSDVMKYTNGSILAEYTDVESGKRSNNRPELLKAIKHAKEADATLVIAKLDRLSRNSVFIGQLMESRVKFVCCDMPEADEFTIHIFAALAQKERKMISARTKDALQVAKQRGVKLGNPQADKAFMDRIRAMRKPKEYDKTVLFIIEQLRPTHSFAKIADELTRQEFKTYHGKNYCAKAVSRIFNRK
jgi:DNA invertase Pin-like site-specific DNA recombinase